ncbi:hypothetical protein TNCV_4013231 [Trichonephila clavipes]|nr:hypothetical protein TNCV_4013231 [Trichonephila clavipes]
MVAQQLTQIIPPAATPDQLWNGVEAAWSAVPRNTSKVSLNNVEASDSGDLQQWRLLYIATDSGRNHISQKFINLII